MKRKACLFAAMILFSVSVLAQAPVPAPSLQEQIDANPGKMIEVPPGEHLLQKRLRIASAGGGLYGFGTLVQANPNEPILEIEHASDVRIKDLTLTRAPSPEAVKAAGLFCFDSRGVIVDGVRVLAAKARDAAIELRQCTDCTVRHCEVKDYQCLAVDDRTENEHYGYAFFCIDGTGILVKDSTGTAVEDNRIVETALFPTREMKEQHHLGDLTEGRLPSHPGDLGKGAFEAGHVNNWHQGSAIVVTGPEATHHTIVSGNHIENAAQGIDLHCDNTVCTNNIVDHGMMGIKGTHGCRNLIISNNMLTHIDLWGILLNPGAISHAAEPETEGKPARPANVDAGTVIANNIISDYGYGNEYWNWGGASPEHGGSYALAFFEGQLPTNPPLTDVLVQGNMVYDTGRDQMLVDGAPKVEAPRYQYAVYIGPWSSHAEPGPTYPKGLHFSGNLFHAGTLGLSNTPLEP